LVHEALRDARKVLKNLTLDAVIDGIEMNLPSIIELYRPTIAAAMPERNERPGTASRLRTLLESE